MVGFFLSLRARFYDKFSKYWYTILKIWSRSSIILFWHFCILWETNKFKAHSLGRILLATSYDYMFCMYLLCTTNMWCFGTINECALLLWYGSTDEEPDGESVGEWPEAEVKELDVKAEPLIMPAERRCNARNWNCGKPAQSGSTMCSEHVKVRDELLKNL